MVFLVIDSSSDKSIILLADGATPIATEEIDGKTSLSSSLFVTIQFLLKSFNLKIKNLECTACGLGPGYYTSLRMAASAAKMLAFGAAIPLIGIPSLMFYEPANEGPFCIVSDAKSHGLYMLSGEKRGDDIFYNEATLLSLSDPSLHNYKELLTPNFSSLKQKIPSLPWQEVSMSPTRMAKLVSEKIDNKEFISNYEIKLIYPG